MKNIMQLLFILLLLSGCTYQYPEIDWIDFIKWDKKEYIAVNDVVIADESFIGEEIGEVQFKVANHVQDANYKSKNGDAAFHRKGTKMYSIKEASNLIALKDSTLIHGYKIYDSSNHKKYNYFFRNIPLNNIHTIEVYNTYSSNNKKVAVWKDRDNIEIFIQLLKTSKNNPLKSMPKREKRSHFDILLYVNGPLAYKISIFYDGEQYFWYPNDTSILSNDISFYLSNKAN
ncbi:MULTISPECIES: hypothetical protein [Bacillus]|uniref:hypothetical protein n=1 Tax=Bacillus TaxID=1386 RepID=UPI0003138279|nr:MULTISPECIES: hypothetical protein [Bacillus]